MHYCSLQHQALLSSPDTSIAEGHFCFVPASSFFVELFLCFSWVAYWMPTDLGDSSSGVCLFVCLFYLVVLFIGFSRQECGGGLPFLSRLNHILTELSSMTCPSWAALLKVLLSASLNYSRLWSMWPSWLALWNCGFCSGGCGIYIFFLF